PESSVGEPSSSLSATKSESCRHLPPFNVYIQKQVRENTAKQSPQRPKWTNLNRVKLYMCVYVCKSRSTEERHINTRKNKMDRHLKNRRKVNCMLRDENSTIEKKLKHKLAQVFMPNHFRR
ncbi:hypothetical protein V8G54_011159, partial [Vigna mungo]